MEILYTPKRRIGLTEEEGWHKIGANGEKERWTEMNTEKINEALFQYIDNSPTAFHALRRPQGDWKRPDM